MLFMDEAYRIWRKEAYIMAQEQIGVIHEVGDLGLGFQELKEEEQKKLQEEKDKKEKK